MPLTRVACPSCNAGLKSATGFALGQKIRCPKCQTFFVVEDPAEMFDEEAEDATPARPAAKKAAAPANKRKPLAAVIDDDEEDEDDRPARDRKKKKKKGSSYKNSPVRFVILGVLLIVLGAMGYLLYEKKQNERQPAKTTTSTAAD